MKTIRLAIFATVFVFLASEVCARGFGRVGGFGRIGGGGGLSFGRRVGGFGGTFGRRPTPFFAQPRRSAPSTVFSPPPRVPGARPYSSRPDTNLETPLPSAKPGARSRTNIFSGDTNLGTPPSARPRVGSGGAAGSAGTFGGVKYPTPARDRYVIYERGYGGVYVPSGYSPWPFYAWFLFPWLFPHPYPAGFAYAHHVGFFGAVLTAVITLVVLGLVVWLVVVLFRSAFRGLRAARRYE
jgi:hypothetical protein